MAGTGYYYMMTRSRLKTRPLEFMKYDPVGRFINPLTPNIKEQEVVHLCV